MVDPRTDVERHGDWQSVIFTSALKIQYFSHALMICSLAGLQSELSSAYGDDIMHLLPLSSSGSGSNLLDQEEAANSDVLARRLQRKMAQKEAQQRYRCAAYLSCPAELS